MKRKTLIIQVLMIGFIIAINGFAFAADKIDVTPFCFANADTGQLVVFSLLTIDFTKSEKATPDWNPPKTSRQVLKIDCFLDASLCNASLIMLNNIESGQKLNSSDVILSDVSIISRTQNVYTLKFGMDVTITVDLHTGRIDYRDSSPAGEGRGVGFCREE